MSNRKSVHFSPGEANIKCLVCNEGKVDTHVLHEEDDGIYYGGISFHKNCFNVEKDVWKSRKLKEGAGGKSE